jgi:hypothetical protein
MRDNQPSTWALRIDLPQSAASGSSDRCWRGDGECGAGALPYGHADDADCVRQTRTANPLHLTQPARSGAQKRAFLCETRSWRRLELTGAYSYTTDQYGLSGNASIAVPF